MNEREKLIELCEDVILSCKASLCGDCEHNKIDYPHCMGVHFADHLLANGVIVPPCKVGDTVWIIDDTSESDDDEPYALEVTVSGVGQDRCGVWVTLVLPLGLKISRYINVSAIGKTVFLTKEEAEAALAERGK